MGGYVALALADLFPDRIEKLLLLNSTFKADSEERKQKRKQAIGIIRQDPKLFIRTVIPNLFPVKARKAHQSTIEELIEKASAMSSEAIVQASEAMIHRPDRSAVFGALKERGALVVAEQDNLVDVQAILAAANAYGNTAELFPGGHMLPFESIDKVRIFLTKFIL